MSDIKPGFYFIEMSGGDWTIAEWINGEWFVPATECAVNIDDRYVGPRIPTPDEMEGWQAVPKEPDLAMIAALGWNGDEQLAIGHGAISEKYAEDFKLALSAAPKPEDV